MKRLGLLILGAMVLVGAAGAGRAEQTDRWKVTCAHDQVSAETQCHVAFFTESNEAGGWLGVAVQFLDGGHEIQVTSAGRNYSSAEIGVRTDTITVTDYCYGSYCVFVNADELVEQFRKGHRANIRLYSGRAGPSIERRVSLMGFTEAYEEYRNRIGE
jgi:invasion protein IalB